MFGLGRAALGSGGGPDSGAPPPPGGNAGPPPRQHAPTKQPLRAPKQSPPNRPGQITLHVYLGAKVVYFFKFNCSSASSRVSSGFLQYPVQRRMQLICLFS